MYQTVDDQAKRMKYCSHSYYLDPRIIAVYKTKTLVQVENLKFIILIKLRSNSSILAASRFQWSEEKA